MEQSPIYAQIIGRFDEWWKKVREQLRPPYNNTSVVSDPDGDIFAMFGKDVCPQGFLDTRCDASIPVYHIIIGERIESINHDGTRNDIYLITEEGLVNEIQDLIDENSINLLQPRFQPGEYGMEVKLWRPRKEE